MDEKKGVKSEALLLGLDLGTTGAKAGVFDGPRLLSSAMVEYPVSTPEPGWAEQSGQSECFGLGVDRRDVPVR